MAAVTALAVPTFSGLKSISVKTSSAKTASTSVKVGPIKASLEQASKALVAAGATILIAGSANAALIKMGGDDGALAFVPKVSTVTSGEVITFKNNAGFPHNIVFDEDEVPEGATYTDHPALINAPGEEFSIKLTTPGSYEFYCEPHQGAGMVGQIIVS